MDVAFADTAVVSEVPVVVFVAYSPKLPALALLFVVVPTMPAVCDGVIVLLNVTAPLKVCAPAKVPESVAPLMVGLVSVLLVSVSVVVRPTRVSVAVGSVSVPVFVMLEITGVVSVGDVPNTSAPEPVSFEITVASWADVVEANCPRLPLVSANVVPQLRPVPLVHFSALFDVLQLGTACATGAAVLPVGLAITVFAATGLRLPATTVAQPGALLGPFETIAWPAVDPDGFSS